MKIGNIKFILLFLFLTLTINAQTTIFVKFREGVSRQRIENFTLNRTSETLNNEVLLKANKSNLWRGFQDPDIGLDRIVRIEIAGTNSDALENYLLGIGDIEYVQKGTVYQVHGGVNDSLFASQWALAKVGAIQAWDITKGEDTVIVGVIDTGVDYLHPDLKNKLFFNPGENGTDNLGRDKKSNGVDDDGNGYIDDYFGWDFTDRVGFPFDSTGGDYLDWDNDPLDQNVFSHGTAVSGIIAAETNNLIGIAGLAPKVRILNLRAFDPDGFGEEDDVASAILYAVTMGVKVINMSFGDYSFSYVLRDVIRYAYSKGVVLVASSGNSNSNAPHYPSGYSEVISVGNSTPEDYVAGSSNYGSTLDLVAPGTSVLTTIKNGKYAEFNGTSAAAPFVSGAAALLLSLQNFTNEEVKQIIKSTADDVGASGWDLRSGAGRLNLYRSLRVLGPAAIKFDSPQQDYATDKDTIKIQATCLSPYFKTASLYYGLGANPQQWNTLIDNIQNQFSNTFIHSLLTINIPDTVITLRLLVTLTNSGTLEERVNIHIMRNTVNASIVSLFPALYGSSPTIIASAFSETPALFRMFYRESGSTNFNFITLDGFAINNQFVKNLHFGFIPKGILKYDANYDLYFEAEGLNGKVRTLKNGSNYFTVKTLPLFTLWPAFQTDEKTSPGIVYKDPVQIGGSSDYYIIKSPLDNSRLNYFYRYANGTFTLSDSLTERIPRDYGDFNSNGKYDILANWGRNTYFLEQKSAGSTEFVTVTEYGDSKYWPVFVRDFKNDGTKQLLTVRNDSTLGLYDVQNNLSLSNERLIPSFTPSKLLDEYTGVFYDFMSFDFPAAEFTDLNNDGINEIWIADGDGDILCYNVAPGGSLVPDTNRSFRTGFFSSAGYLAAGDFNGDNIKDLAILLHSVENVDIADYHRLIVVSFSGNKPIIIFDQAFLDPATEFSIFTKRTYNSIRFASLYPQPGEQLIVSLFPYAYVFEYSSGTGKVIYYDENVNSNSVFVYNNPSVGLPKFGISTSSEFRLIQLNKTSSINTPSIRGGFSIDSSRIKIEWDSPYNEFSIFRGTDKDNLQLISVTTQKYYLDSGLELGKEYYYSVLAFSGTLNSAKSQPFKVFHHRPAKFSVVSVNNASSLKVSFTEKMSNVITNLRALYLLDSSSEKIFPNSIASIDQFSYLVAFRGNLTPGSYRITSDGLTDLYGSPVLPDTLLFDVSSVSAKNEFYITSFEIKNPYTISIRFNLEADPVTALQKINYRFSPDNSINSISINPSDPKEIFLDLQGGKPVGAIGREYTLNLENIYSSSSTGNVRINTGAGSSLVLTANASGTSDVFVYPSPVKFIDGREKIVTFANLPRYARISVWNLTGDRIIDLEERDGNGGVTWNLLDSKGKEIATGVYYYRVTMLNETGEEIENKLGKFAVIR
ncbi:MAG: S8 family serine peptidase [Ignavibacteriaceae bacterium]|nr:S8 family serine peptidase [Ignavibacteriaceae bacterium]